jgi:hypothetical protein
MVFLPFNVFSLLNVSEIDNFVELLSAGRTVIGSYPGCLGTFLHLIVWAHAVLMPFNMFISLSICQNLSNCVEFPSVGRVVTSSNPGCVDAIATRRGEGTLRRQTTSITSFASSYNIFSLQRMSIGRPRHRIILLIGLFHGEVMHFDKYLHSASCRECVMFPLCGPIFPYPRSYARLVLKKGDCTARAVTRSYPGCLHAIAHSTCILYLSYFVGSYFEAYSLLGVLLSVSSLICPGM